MGVRLHVRSGWGEPGPEEPVVYAFDQGRVVLGRGRGADVRLPHRAVSLRHATLEVGAGRVTLTDHGSTNGTRVNGAPLVPGRSKLLTSGDVLLVGGFALRVEVGVPVARATTAGGTASLARRLARQALAGAPPLPRVVVLNGPQLGLTTTLPEPRGALVVGRDEACGLPLDDADASREHAAFVVDLDGVELRDRGSKNGTQVNGRPVESHRLEHRDEIRVGGTVLVFDDPAGAELRGLDGGDDEALGAAALPAPGDSRGAPGDTATVPDGESEPPAPTGRSGVGSADLVIYALAALVIALSLLGLLWLVRAS
ncbi:MAG: FHA domain-containing protein [Sandaracinaceae bacterium]